MVPGPDTHTEVKFSIKKFLLKFLPRISGISYLPKLEKLWDFLYNIYMKSEESCGIFRKLHFQDLDIFTEFSRKENLKNSEKSAIIYIENERGTKPLSVNKST